MAHDLMRCLKRQLHWTLENGTGCLNNWRHMDSAQMLLLGVKAWAHGEVLHTKFPWRAFAFGFEQYVLALVDQADRPTRAYQATKQLHDVYQRLPDLTIDDFVSEVAFVLNYHDSWAYQSLSGSPNYVFVAERYYTSLHRLGLCLDVIAETADFSRYRVLVFPPSLFCDETLADKVRAFIAEGGVVILSSQSFSRNRNFQWHAEPAPFHLQDVFGVSVREGCYAANYLGNATSCLGFDFASLDAEPSGFDEYRLSSDIFSLAGLPAMTYFEALEENGAEVWARYQEGLFSGQAAITSHVYGKGHAILVGCGLSEEGLRAVYRHVLARAGVTMTPAVNREVEIVPLRRHTVYLNHTQIACREPLGTGTALLGQVEDDMLVLPPYGFAVVAHTLSAATIEENILIAVDK
jgi:beta-galactosidase